MKSDTKGGETEMMEYFPAIPGQFPVKIYIFIENNNTRCYNAIVAKMEVTICRGS